LKGHEALLDWIECSGDCGGVNPLLTVAQHHLLCSASALVNFRRMAYQVLLCCTYWNSFVQLYLAFI